MARPAAIVSAACFGILGFVNPFRIYHQFMSALRTLDYACQRYRYGKVEIDDLLEALRLAEQQIQNIDELVTKLRIPRRASPSPKRGD
jgi:hypothetical protein